MQQVFKIPDSLKKNTEYTFCPGCGHGVAVRLLCQAIDDFGLRDNAICMVGVGCTAFLYHFLDIDALECPHGRATAEGTGVKRINPDKFVFTYQGDGDYAAIGMTESMYAGIRGENLTTICVNNTNYGMTGGQLGPTTTMGQVTSTSPMGRNKEYHGYPIKTAEHIALCDGASFSARVALYDVKNIINAKNAIKKAFSYQLEDLGYSFVEILSSCPTNWKLSPKASHDKIKDELCRIYPVGVFKDVKNHE